jgi:hypothetical protein
MFALQIYAVGVGRGRLLRSRRRHGSGDRSPLTLLRTKTVQHSWRSSAWSQPCRALIRWRRADASRRGRSVYQAVVATLDAGMIPVARDQQDGVVVAIRVPGVADVDLPEIVDLVRLNQLKAGAGRNQSIQINYGAAGL